MVNGNERDELLAFCCQHCNGNKYIHQYHIEDIEVPGITVPSLEGSTMAKLDKLSYLGISFLMQFTNGIVEMATWDKREPGSIAGTSTTM